MAGLEVLAGALVLTAVVAVLHRRQDGRLRQTRAVARATKAAQTQAAQTQGAQTQGAQTQGGGERGGDEREDLRPLLERAGERAGERATLLQFSSAFCAPCRATKRVLGEVAQHLEGVEHVEIDAESNLDLVRRLHILKTPTTLVLDAHGREVSRATGQPRKADVVAALGQAVPS